MEDGVTRFCDRGIIKELNKTCEAPFELVPGVGCLWVYENFGNFNAALEKCQSLDADLFEFSNYEKQTEALEVFLRGKG